MQRRHNRRSASYEMNEANRRSEALNFSDVAKMSWSFLKPNRCIVFLRNPIQDGQPCSSKLADRPRTIRDQISHVLTFDFG